DRLLVARALHPDPSRRWRSAVELIDALQQLSGEVLLPPVRDAQTNDHRSAATAAPAAAVAFDVLQMCFGTNLPADVIRQRLDGFQKQWNARILASDDCSLVLQMQSPRNFWQRWTGRQPHLEVHLSVGQPEVTVPAGVQVRTEVRMDIRPHAGSR